MLSSQRVKQRKMTRMNFVIHAIFTTATSVVLLMTASVTVQLSPSEYMKMRSEMIDEDESTRIGANLVLSSPELKVNDIFMKEKRDMIESSRVNRTIFIPSTSFYVSKSQIEKTYLYKLIDRMPKGAALHIHDQSMVSLDWIIQNVTYRDHVYTCLWKQSYPIYRFFKTKPTKYTCEWKLIIQARQEAKDVKAFDLDLRNSLSLLATDPFVQFPDNQAAWIKFGRFFYQIGKLLYYIPIFRDMLWQTMEEFREANVQYIEVRVDYIGLYDYDGKVYNREYCVKLVKEVSDAFVQRYPDFIGMKIIFLGSRNHNVSEILEEVKDVMALHKNYPDVVSGYDLSGNEALYNPLSFYREALLYPSQQDPPYHLPYFFHAGETIWQGTETGYNVVDALLLNATRVGHAYVLNKHPHLMRLYKERGIPLEVQPISNQVLRLVSDLRNHPMASLIADNYSVVISCDDRTTLDSAPLSHDFFLCFTTMSSERADLTLLKQLAINSIRFSTLNDALKDKAMGLWQTKWDKFIVEVEKENPMDPVVSTASYITKTQSPNAAQTQFKVSWFTGVILGNLITYITSQYQFNI